MNGRTKFIVAWLVLLYVAVWAFSLSRLFGMHFWDVEYVKATSFPQDDKDDSATTVEFTPDPSMYNSTTLDEVAYSYYSPKRYLFFLPHVLGAIVWWNFYFLQLIPKVRHAFNYKLHRIMGRCLMLAALLQAVTGFGLALTTTAETHVILLVSVAFGAAVLYCLYYAYKYARARDIPRHKYWVLRMVGYLQTISLQRFWFVVLLSTHQLGWYGLYPNVDEDTTDGVVNEQGNQIVRQMFDDSFLISIFMAFLMTEWYLAGEQGMMVEPVKTVSAGDDHHDEQQGEREASEDQPLLVGQSQHLSTYS